MANEELLNEEEISILSLTDEEGNEVEFELIDSVDYEGVEYLILLPPRRRPPRSSFWRSSPTRTAPSPT